MNRAAALVVLVAALLLGAPPASAYEVDLQTWNTTTIQNSGDFVKVLISGQTIEFIYVAGANPPGIAADMLDIFWTQNVVNGGGAVTGFNGPNCPAFGHGCYTIGTVPANATDGFNSLNGYSAYVVDASVNTNFFILDETFTFASTLPTGLVANDFVVDVLYSNSCSGFVGGPGNGGVLGSATNNNCVATPVPEPMTMFLGGTGLLVMGYVARKRLFAIGRSWAV